MSIDVVKCLLIIDRLRNILERKKCESFTLGNITTNQLKWNTISV